MGEYYVRKLTRVFGPYGGGTLKKLMHEGKLCETDEIGATQAGPWQSASTVKGLFAPYNPTEVRDRSPTLQDAASDESYSTTDINDDSLFFQAADVLVAAPPPLPKSIPGPSATPAKQTQNSPSRIPTKRGRRVVVSAILSVGVLVIGGVCFALMNGGRPTINPIQSIANAKLQSRFDSVVDRDSRNRGVKVSVYYRGSVNRDVVVFDLQKIDSDKSTLDVFRVLIDFADEVQDSQLEWVELACQGDVQFKISGAHFKTLGVEREFQNPVYTIRTLPENLYTPDGRKAFSEWTGGAISVMGKQMEDFNEFNEQWYLNRFRRESED